MAKCGNMILIDDKLNKATALRSSNLSLIAQKNLVEGEDGDF